MEKKLPDDGTTCPKHVGAKQVNKQAVITCNCWFIIIIFTVMYLRVPKNAGVTRLREDLCASQEGLCPV
jgi:hypothetical protein